MSTLQNYSIHVYGLTGSSGFFSWECPWARHFRAQPSTGETQEIMNNVNCRRDMTEILLKAA